MVFARCCRSVDYDFVGVLATIVIDCDWCTSSAYVYLDDELTGMGVMTVCHADEGAYARSAIRMSGEEGEASALDSAYPVVDVEDWSGEYCYGESVVVTVESGAIDRWSSGGLGWHCDLGTAGILVNECLGAPR